MTDELSKYEIKLVDDVDAKFEKGEKLTEDDLGIYLAAFCKNEEVVEVGGAPVIKRDTSFDTEED